MSSPRRPIKYHLGYADVIVRQNQVSKMHRDWMMLEILSTLGYEKHNFCQTELEASLARGRASAAGAACQQHRAITGVVRLFRGQRPSYGDRRDA